jgi:hypothetical protein
MWKTMAVRRHCHGNLFLLVITRSPTEVETNDSNSLALRAMRLERLYLLDVTMPLPWFETRKKELANRPLIREQAFGEALDPDKLERLGRYEVHLDRKLERMLAMLLRLKDLRRVLEPT